MDLFQILTEIQFFQNFTSKKVSALLVQRYQLNKVISNQASDLSQNCKPKKLLLRYQVSHLGSGLGLSWRFAFNK